PPQADNATASAEASTVLATSCFFIGVLPEPIPWMGPKPGPNNALLTLNRKAGAWGARWRGAAMRQIIVSL
ncbi:hypothetical protein, partial [Xanthomonas citri]|uniref:hypothetical protein n=1 Tax=Xanthomonas citri TaxID=346 RepID=UPI001F4631E0